MLTDGILNRVNSESLGTINRLESKVGELEKTCVETDDKVVAVRLESNSLTAEQGEKLKAGIQEIDRIQVQSKSASRSDSF